MDFKETFNKVSEKEKTDYLFSLLSKDEKLKKDFLNSVSINPVTNGGETIDYAEFAESASDFYDEFLSDMESLDLEETDWEDYTPPHGGYVAEWEAAQYMAEQEADGLFEYMNEHIVSLLFKSEMESLVAELLAFYFASLEADINDPYDNLDNPNDYFSNMHKGFVDYAIEKISISSTKDSILTNSIKLFFKYFETAKTDSFENIKPFEGLLLVLLNSIENKENIKQLGNITEIDKKYFPQYSLRLDKRLGNKTSWLEHAKQFYLIDRAVGNELLEHYYKGDIAKYVSTAKELFNNDKRYWAEILALKLLVKHDQDLYKDVHARLCVDKHLISDYKKIMDMLSENEKGQLHNELHWRTPFRVEIYAEEKQYGKIKELVEKNIDSYDFNKLIEPILNVYREFCFTTIEKKANTAINRERGRSAYRQIASWLKPAKNIHGYESRTKELILRLYNHKPNLPALKDEFRGAGLV